LILASYWLEKNPSRRPRKPLRFIENWLSKASPRAAMVQVNKWWETEAATNEMAAKMGMKAKGNEGWPEFRARIAAKIRSQK
jgi:hypothetical protein